MEQALRALLASALPHVPAKHINWGEHPQSAGRPYIVLHLISTISGHDMQGPEAMERSRVQVDCFARQFGDARALAAAVKGALDFHRGGRFLGILFDGLRTSREAPGDDGDALYRASQDFLVNWRADHAG